MSKKVGIITVHKNVNYGANLQAYASSKYISKLGYDAKIIDYTLPSHEESAHLYSWLKQSWDRAEKKPALRKVKLISALAISIPWKSKRLKNFKKFRKKYMNLTCPCKTGLDIAKVGLDTVVCGSDQIWNPTITDGINPLFFGDIDGVEKRISYAASVGKEKYSEEDELKVKDLLNKLDYISVREQNTAEYLSTLTDKKIETVCDPVFLLDKEGYDKVLSKRKIKGDYVLLYSVIHNDELTAIAKTYAQKKGLKLIEICGGKDKGATHKQILTYGPAEFLSAFKYAKTIFTNSFHGTAFSLIFKKDFYVVDNKYGGSRIINILNKANCLDRLIESPITNDLPSIDYQNVRNKLSAYVESSKAFLEKALTSEKTPLAEDKCIGCGACQAVCKYNAITLLPNSEGFLWANIDTSKCVDCGLCKKVCPAINESEKNKGEPYVYAFKANDQIRKDSTSGGAFASFAKKIVENGGVFYGATQLKDFSVKHIRGETFEDISKVQGTKYLQSDISSCYNLIENVLRLGKIVLFSGTPCQVDALNRFVLMKKIPNDNLFTVDIICHGVPSKVVYRDYLLWLEKKYKSKIVDYKFRSKSISWRGSSCYAKFENGLELKNDKKLCSFMNLYYSDNITRESCYSCKYTIKQRVSDITISDYWGIENVDKDFEDKLGVSMVLINTDKGERFFEQVEGEKIVGNLQKAIQPQLKKPTARPHTREEFWDTYKKKGLKPLLKKYGGVKSDSLKTKLYKLKQKILK